MKPIEINQQLRYLNYKIHLLLNCTRDHQLTVEMREKMAELSVAIMRILPQPFYGEEK